MTTAARTLAANAAAWDYWRWHAGQPEAWVPAYLAARGLRGTSAGQAPAAAPVNGTGYAANARFGAGAAVAADEYVVYGGSGTSVTVTGLVPGRTYYAAVYPFNGAGCEAAYLTAAPATADAALPVPPASSYRFYRGNLHAHSSYSDGNKDAATSGASSPS